MNFNLMPSLMSLVTWDLLISLNANLKECTSTLEGHSGEILSVAATPSSLLVSGSSDATVKLWRNAEVETTCLGHEGPVYSVARW